MGLKASGGGEVGLFWISPSASSSSSSMVKGEGRPSWWSSDNSSSPTIPESNCLEVALGSWKPRMMIHNGIKIRRVREAYKRTKIQATRKPSTPIISAAKLTADISPIKSPSAFHLAPNVVWSWILHLMTLKKVRVKTPARKTHFHQRCSRRKRCYLCRRYYQKRNETYPVGYLILSSIFRCSESPQWRFWAFE